MCFKSKPGYTDKLLATQDILCYKVMERLPRYNYRAPYLGSWYKLSKDSVNAQDYFASDITDLKLEYDNDYEGFVIYCGFHSFIDKPDLDEFKGSFTGVQGGMLVQNFVIVECTIPKGTYYYKNDKEYVSVHLKFNKEI